MNVLDKDIFDEDIPVLCKQRHLTESQTVDFLEVYKGS